MVKARLPETLPEFPAAAGVTEFDALSMVEATNPATPAEGEGSGVQPIGQAWSDVRDEMQGAFAVADYERALVLAERLLQHDDNDVIARMCLEESRVRIEAQLTELLFPLDRVVVPRIRAEELTKARIDARGAFLFTRADGATTLEDLLDIAAMPRLDALRYFAEWATQGYVVLR